MSPPLLLIPPSAGMAKGGKGPRWPADDGHPLAEARAAVADAAGEAITDWSTLPAMQRYTGVLYGELAYAARPVGLRRKLDGRLLIATALAGWVTPRDPLPTYRLPMTASLPGLGRLSTWWRPRMSAELARVADGRVVWDLLPNEHAAAVDWSAVSPSRRITVRFVDRSGATVSHWNKLLKGALAVHVAATDLRDPRKLADFDHPLGYRFDPDASEITRARAAVVMREA